MARDGQISGLLGPSFKVIPLVQCMLDIERERAADSLVASWLRAQPSKGLLLLKALHLYRSNQIHMIESRAASPLIFLRKFNSKRVSFN